MSTFIYPVLLSHLFNISLQFVQFDCLFHSKDHHDCISRFSRVWFIGDSYSLQLRLWYADEVFAFVNKETRAGIPGSCPFRLLDTLHRAG